jgi:RNA polymerase sigma-70 factor (ECF subfamily)
VYHAVHSLDHDIVRNNRYADPQTLTLMYQQYAKAIYRYAFIRVQDEALAQDIQSEVFLRVVEGIDRYEERGLPLVAWLFRITHDRSVDSLRRRYRRPQVSLERCHDLIEEDDSHEQREISSEVQRFLHELCPLQRSVIQLRFFEYCSIQEVAQRLGRSEGAIRALTHRGLRTLRKMMEQEGMRDA